MDIELIQNKSKMKLTEANDSTKENRKRVLGKENDPKVPRNSTRSVKPCTRYM
jgi:hypothetical protein